MRLKAKLPRDYAEQTYASPYRIIRYPHQKRYEAAVGAITASGAASVLDYGAGDCHVLSELDPATAPARIVAYEPDADAASIARERMASANLGDRFELVESLEGLTGEFDLIICLGVLEHMPLLERERFYRLLEDHLSPRGRCLIDVPVEIGPTLLVKELGRIVLKGRDARYRTRELLGASVGLGTFDPQRFAADDTRTWIHFHTGFDYRLFERELRARFSIVERFGVPLRRLPPWLLNQEAFYLIERRADAAG